MFLVEGKLKAELLRLTKLRAPNEAVGLLLRDQRILELTNDADEELRDSTFVVDREELIGMLVEAEVDSIKDVTFWHSHPAGGIGPSAIDMRSRTPFGYHLVVSLVGDDIVATWY